MVRRFWPLAVASAALIGALAACAPSPADEGSKLPATGPSVTSPPDSPPPSAATLVSIHVTPSLATITKGNTQQHVATGTYTDSSIKDLTASASWSSSSASVASISAGGLATGVAAGTVYITATSGAVTSDVASLTVMTATLLSIKITPAATSIAAGTAQQFTATGAYSDATQHDQTEQAAWTSSATGTATISASGLATGISAGTVAITATYVAKVDTATLTVK